MEGREPKPADALFLGIEGECYAPLLIGDLEEKEWKIRRLGRNWDSNDGKKMLRTQQHHLPTIHGAFEGKLSLGKLPSADTISPAM